MKTPNQLIESLFSDFQANLGCDFLKYKNHVYRVFYYCKTLDQNEENLEKYTLAAFFHDIGIWTNNTFDYLDPSILLLEKYLTKKNQIELIEEISSMIYWHHKVTKYEGKYQITVENFRKADWIDISFGLKNFGVDNSHIKYISKTYPDCGFHWFLVKIFLRNLLKKPFQPLPMFKF